MNRAEFEQERSNKCFERCNAHFVGANPHEANAVPLDFARALVVVFALRGFVVAAAVDLDAQPQRRAIVVEPQSFEWLLSTELQPEHASPAQ